MRGNNISPDYKPECKWSEGIVRRLLKNVQYTGAYVSGRERQDYETGKRYKMRQCDWIVIPNKHPAIISSDVFEKVQKLLQNSKKSTGKGSKRNIGNKGKGQNNDTNDIQDTPHLSGTIIKCGCCSYGLRYSKQANPPRYHCVHTLSLLDAKCHKMKVNAFELENALLMAIKKQAEVVIGSDDLTGFRKSSEDIRKMADYDDQIKALSAQRQECYERFMSREIDRDTFMAMKSEYTAQIDVLNNQAVSLRQIKRNRESQDKIVALTKEMMSKTATPKDIVIALVEKVFVFPDNRLEIHWKFEDFTK